MKLLHICLSHTTQRQFLRGFTNSCGRACVSWTNSLLDSQEAEQRLVGLFVETEDALPVLDLLLLLLQAVEGEERRVESREQQGEEQRGAAQHNTAGGERGRQRWGWAEQETPSDWVLFGSCHLVTNHWICSETWTFIYTYLCVCWCSPLLCCVRAASAFGWRRRSFWDDVSIIW